MRERKEEEKRKEEERELQAARVCDRIFLAFGQFGTARLVECNKILGVITADFQPAEPTNAILQLLCVDGIVFELIIIITLNDHSCSNFRRR